MFWRNLNVFIASAALLMGIVGGPLVMVLTYILMLMTGKDIRVGFAVIPVVMLALPSALAYHWWKSGLAPKEVNPTRHNRHLYGHLILAIGNFMAVAFPLLGVLALTLVWREWEPIYNPDQRLYERLLTLGSAVTIPSWVVGLAMVLSSRGSASTTASPSNSRHAA